jgi:ABC-2 type transport system ATP-binding protein
MDPRTTLVLEIEPGEVFGFVAPIGARKSPKMRVLLDVIKQTSGRASVLGLDTRQTSLAIRRRVGVPPGDLVLYPNLTGANVLDYLAELRSGADRRVRDGLAERLHTDRDRPMRELSTGNPPLDLPVVTDHERTLSRLAELSAVRWQPAASASHLV